MSRQPGSKENKDFLSFSDMAAPIVSGDSEGVYTELTSQDNHEYYTLSRTSHDSPGPQHTDKTAQSLHPYKRTAVCLGLLCALLLIATLALLVLYTSLSQKYSALDASLKSSTGDEHKDEQLRHCAWLKELLQKKHENVNKRKNQLEKIKQSLERNKFILQRHCSILEEKILQLQKNCTDSGRQARQM